MVQTYLTYPACTTSDFSYLCTILTSMNVNILLSDNRAYILVNFVKNSYKWLN
ncbi:hypothetical protein GGR42_001088 [Saonia flava]|uniref:Uncharacterized protein n=1 Tax=Saonia flava TaxID=523696 RepID=A0A846QNJ4_9FLAO|nr:hypothetical protein [Saonia flava]